MIHLRINRFKVTNILVSVCVLLLYYGSRILQLSSTCVGSLYKIASLIISLYVFLAFIFLFVFWRRSNFKTKSILDIVKKVTNDNIKIMLFLVAFIIMLNISISFYNPVFDLFDYARVFLVLPAQIMLYSLTKITFDIIHKKP